MDWADTGLEKLPLLGREYDELGTYVVRTQFNGRSACSISAGKCLAPSKAPGGSRNEDALIVVDDGPRTMMVVCDAHYGDEASHVTIEKLEERLGSIPSSPIDLFELVRGLPDPSKDVFSPSETTFLIAVLDRERGAGFSLSFGDSTLMLLGMDRGVQKLNRTTSTYVQPWIRDSLDPRRGKEAAFRVRPGELLVAFTDGINECHYGAPQTSVQDHHFESMLIRTGGDPQDFVRGLTKLALEGVEGSPGGEDNIALVASRS